MADHSETESANIPVELFVIENRENREVICPSQQAESLVAFFRKYQSGGRHKKCVLNNSLYDYDAFVTTFTKEDVKKLLRGWFKTLKIEFTEVGDFFHYRS